MGALRPKGSPRPLAQMRDWLEKRQIEDPGFNQSEFHRLLLRTDPTLRCAPSTLSRILTGQRQPSEHLRLVFERLTGVPSNDWLPANIRRLAKCRAA